uniref:ATP synthase YMF19-like N-terminal domain-containing protein n=1 Tax=Paravannella minima TaxID=1443144 RepID=A0A411K7S4_9EUKA|nr:hypothetical protein [Paravannella minima]QBC73440.1 hypothetical protein [Paravannella minima]
MPQLDQVTFFLQSSLVSFFFFSFFIFIRFNVLPEISSGLKLREYLLNNLKLSTKYLLRNCYFITLFIKYLNLILIKFVYSCFNIFFFFLKYFFFFNIILISKEFFINICIYINEKAKLFDLYNDII